MIEKPRLPLGVEFSNESIIGTRFTGRLLSETRVGDFVAINPLVTGRTFIAGIQPNVHPLDSRFKIAGMTKALTYKMLKNL